MYVKGPKSPVRNKWPLEIKFPAPLKFAILGCLEETGRKQAVKKKNLKNPRCPDLNRKLAVKKEESKES